MFRELSSKHQRGDFASETQMPYLNEAEDRPDMKASFCAEVSSQCFEFHTCGVVCF